MLQIISLVCVGLNAYAYAYRWEAWRSESEEVFFSYEYIYIYMVPFVQAPERFLIGSLSTWLLVAESLSPRLFNWPAYRLFRDK